MKNGSVYFFIFLLNLPIATTISSYVYWLKNLDHIQKDLCVNRNNPRSKCKGKCHLSKAIKKNYEQENSTRKQNKIILESNFILIYLPTENFNFQHQIEISSVHSSVVFSYKTLQDKLLEFDTDPPPKRC